MALLTLSSCAMMTQEEPDCNPYYKVRFIFERNLLFHDAFSSQVEDIDLYVFDEEGQLVWQGHEEGEALATVGYMMDLPLPPGKYELIAWGHKKQAGAKGFLLAGGDTPLSPSDLRTSMERRYEGEDAISDSPLHALYHGRLSTVDLPDKWGTHVVTLPLTKDTNTIRVMLVHLSGKEIKSEDFSFAITDMNGDLDYDNTILDDEWIRYSPYTIENGVARTDVPEVTASGAPAEQPGLHPVNAVTEVHSLIAGFSTSRLQTCRRPVLTVTRNSDGEKVIDIPILDYFLMVKGEYGYPMKDDEYLDRQDNYSMTFFMNEDGSWYKAVIDILSWRLVRQTTHL